MLNHGASGWKCSEGRRLSDRTATPKREPLPRAMLEQPVLVIEDEAMIAWTLESLLEDIGFEMIIVTARGEDAIVAAQEFRPGLIVSDINLGPYGLDGIATAIALRQTVLIPVLFVTGNAGSKERARIGQDLPDALVLTKPIAQLDLERALAHLAQHVHLH